MSSMNAPNKLAIISMYPIPVSELSKLKALAFFTPFDFFLCACAPPIVHRRLRDETYLWPRIAWTLRVGKSTRELCDVSGLPVRRRRGRRPRGKA